MTTSSGADLIEWAGRAMPALADARDSLAASGLLEGRRVGILLTLEPKTANLALAAAALGAEVAVFCEGHSTMREVAEALTESGISVFAEASADDDRDDILREQFIDFGFEFLIDDGASIIRRIHSERRDALAALIGASEETTSGVRPLRVMEADGSLEIPCVAVNDARTKSLFDNGYGTGQSVVMTVLDTTNLQMQGTSVVVLGYGPVGQGIARYCAGLGGRVTVTEIDPIAALQALHDGHQVCELADVIADADIFITASGIGYTLDASDLAQMRDGAIVAVGGAGPPELVMDEPPGLLVDLGEVRPQITAFRSERGTVFVVARGECANTSAAEGNPIEIMDLSLALQLRSLAYLAANADSLGPGVHELPSDADDAVARSQLRAMGVRIDTPNQRQTEAAQSW